MMHDGIQYNRHTAYCHASVIDLMTQSKVKVTSPSNLEIRPFSNAISSAIYNGSCQLTTDS